MAPIQERRAALSVETPRWLITQAIAAPFNENLHQDRKALGFVFSSPHGAEVINQFTQCELLHFDLANLRKKHEILSLEILTVLAQINPELEWEFTLDRIKAGIGPARWMQLKTAGEGLIERWEKNQAAFEKALAVAKRFAKRQLGLHL
jgi:hypothetical protein